MPLKPTRDRRHRIPKQRHRVTNWAVYDASLRARGSLTVWFTTEAIEAWKAEPRIGRGGSAALLQPGDHDSVDPAGGVPPGAAPNGGADRLHPAPARPRPRGARRLHPEPPG